MERDGKSLCDFNESNILSEGIGKNCLSDPNLELSSLHEESIYDEVDFLEEYLEEKGTNEKGDDYSEVIRMYSSPSYIVVGKEDDIASLHVTEQSGTVHNEMPPEYESHFIDDQSKRAESDRVNVKTFVLGKERKRNVPSSIESIESFDEMTYAKGIVKDSAAVFSFTKLDKLKAKNAVKCRIKKYKFNNREKEIVVGDESDRTVKSSMEEEGSSERNRKEENRLYEEVEKRVIQPTQSKNLQSRDEEIKRFYLANSSSVANIETCFKINDLRSTTLLGKMVMREGKESWNEHWFQFKGNNLSCYNKKKMPLTVIHSPNEAAGDIIHPSDSNYFLTRKFMINIFESRVYLVKNKPRLLDCIRCPMFFRSVFPEMLDITESVILMIVKQGKNYKVTIKEPAGTEVFVLIPNLEFALETNGSYIFLRVDDIEIFLRWIVSILFRQGRLDIKYG